MTGPSWLADVLAAVVISVALFSAGRLIATRGRPRRGEVDADGVHILMGVAMAGMFVPRLATLPDPAWEVIFVAGAAWFGWRSVQVRLARSPHPGFESQCCEYPVPHLIDCAAMLYALWAVPVIRSGAAPGSGGMSAMAGAASGARLPALGLVLALGICGYVVWLGDRVQLLAAAPAAMAAAPAAGGLATASSLTTASSPARVSGHALLAPRAATCCKIAMGVAMGVMLVDIL
jgi:hypothetical protein